MAPSRRDRNHQITTRLAVTHAAVITEDLAVKRLVASAKGTAEMPVKVVRRKAGLNREILATAPRSWSTMSRDKAEEAGRRLILADLGKHRSS